MAMNCGDAGQLTGYPRRTSSGRVSTLQVERAQHQKSPYETQRTKGGLMMGTQNFTDEVLVASHK